MSDNHLPDALPGLNLKEGISRIGGSHKNYLKLLMKFSANHKNALQEIKKKLSDNDIDSALRFAHNLKGIAGNIGAENLYNAAISLESVIKDNKQNEWESRINSAENFLEELLSSISTISAFPEIAESKDSEINERNIERNIENSKIEMNKAVLIIKDLKSSIKGYNAGSLDILKSLEHILRNTLFLSEIQDIEKFLEKYDFDNALNALQKLIRLMKISDLF
jgi:two-component system sensor histidine kinase/response regulator